MIALDGTATKERLGANALLGVSLAASHAAANENKEPTMQRMILVRFMVLILMMVLLCVRLETKLLYVVVVILLLL